MLPRAFLPFASLLAVSILLCAAPPPTFDPEPVVALLELVLDPQSGDVDAARQSLGVLASKIQSRELSTEQLTKLRPRLDELLGPILAGSPDAPLFADAAILATHWKNNRAVDAAKSLVRSPANGERRLAAFAALVSTGDASVRELAAAALADGDKSWAPFRSGVLAALGRSEDSGIADLVLKSYGKLDAELQPRAIELLTQRSSWSKSLLAAVGRGDVPPAALNVNQVRRLLDSKDAELVKAVQEKWGNIRAERDPKREQVLANMRRMLQTSRGNPRRGEAVFHRVCGQCHKIHGRGAEVGPDITSNGRASFEQLLSNVFDPSLVIGASYQAVMVRTMDGRVLTGLPVEDSPERVVLKVQGGKQETVAREDVDEQRVSSLSLMPEELEKQLKPQEIADLFAFLCLEGPLVDSAPSAKRLPGTPRALLDGP